MDNPASTARHARRLAAPFALVAVVVLLVLPAHSWATEPTATSTPAPAAAAPAPTSTATLVDPAEGTHFDHLELAPMLQFDPVKDQTPKWILLASDAGMTQTVRYCRQFVWATFGGAYHWGCNKWATGADQFGNDQLLALEPGKVYYWQVVTKDAAGTGELKTAVRSFAIDAEPTQASVGAISDQVHGTAFDDGTQLNLGAAAFVNSKVRTTGIASSRLSTYAFRIRATHVGLVDYTRSYIKVTSAAGTHYLKVASAGKLTAGTVWRLTASERRLRTKRFTYQAFLRSKHNGAMVRSQLRVVLIRTPVSHPQVNPD
ncbi:MAG: hypothetical protein JWM98_367 [Thermoleophilia bacterium]|nr:hypothetical protein [Thermoleophilia bacterium]